MKKTYHGSCHCGAVRFECELDLAPDASARTTNRWYASTFKCNCSFCTKTRFWKGFVRADGFRLLQGQEVLTDYQFGERSVHHPFCNRCGVRPFSRSHLDVMGGDFYAINVTCLDDATPEEWVAAPVTYEDGRHDAWESTPAETRYL